MQPTKEQLVNRLVENIRKSLITEAFKSNILRKFIQQHGGVDNDYRQFSLGDISDEQIGWAREFDSPNEAMRALTQIKKPNEYGRRSELDMKYFFLPFVAKDNTTLVIGVDRNKIQTLHSWEGEHEKKVSDRLARNGWNFKVRSNKYVDDSDTYYYQSPAKDFGIWDSNGFQNVKNANAMRLANQPEEERDMFN